MNQVLIFGLALLGAGMLIHLKVEIQVRNHA